MINWYNCLSGYSKSMFILGVVMTIFLVIQIIMLLTGMGDDADVDIDPSDVDINETSFGELAGLKILSVRTINIFLCIGAWVGISMDTNDCPLPLSIIVSILSGGLSAFLFAFAMKKVMKLQGDGSIDFKNAEGKEGEVYLTIPADKSRYGKINVLVQERIVEIPARSIDGVEIKTGEAITVVEVVNNIANVRRK